MYCVTYLYIGLLFFFRSHAGASGSAHCMFLANLALKAPRILCGVALPSPSQEGAGLLKQSTASSKRRRLSRDVLIRKLCRRALGNCARPSPVRHYLVKVSDTFTPSVPYSLHNVTTLRLSCVSSCVYVPRCRAWTPLHDHTRPAHEALYASFYHTATDARAPIGVPLWGDVPTLGSARDLVPPPPTRSGAAVINCD